MTKFVRNDGGTVHSVGDGFAVPDGWDEVDEATARAEHPALFGEPDPAVDYDTQLPDPAADQAPATDKTNPESEAAK